MPFLVDTSPSPLYEGNPYAKVSIELALASVGLGQVFNVSLSLMPPSDITMVSSTAYLGTISEEASFSASFVLDTSKAQPGQYDIPAYLLYQPTPWSFSYYVVRKVTIWVRPFPQDPFSLISATSVPAMVSSGAKGVRLDLTISYPDGISQPLHQVSAVMKSVMIVYVIPST